MHILDSSMYEGDLADGGIRAGPIHGDGPAQARELGKSAAGAAVHVIRCEENPLSR